MDERMTRLWAAAEARALGVGGGVIATNATGIRSKRISHGQRDLDELETAPPAEKPRDQRVRRPGAGRKPLMEIDPTLLDDLESPVDPVTRGVAALVLFAGAIFNFTAGNEAREKMSRRANDQLAMENAMGRLNTFYADPNRGGVLSRFYAEHPVYGHPLPNVDDMPPVSSHVIERQAVVVRCKYCQNLTPVDSHACRTCGAAGFA